MEDVYKIIPGEMEISSDKVKSPIKYYRNCDGLTVTEGETPGSGFVCGGRGITIPAEINGIPVTELKCVRKASNTEYIEAWNLKRIRLDLRSNYRSSEEQNHDLVDSFIASFDSIQADRLLCEPPVLYGGVQCSIEEMHLTYVADKLEIHDFSGIKSLKSVSFCGHLCASQDWEDTVYTEGMFRNCRNLECIEGEGFYGGQFGSESFAGCTSLRRIPRIHVKRLCDREFDNCHSLESVRLCDGLFYIGSNCFRNCWSLKDVYIPDTVKGFSSNIFKDCHSLQTVHLPKNMDAIPDGMFDGCAKLQKIFLADTITRIGIRAFAGCSSLKSPWIPENLEEIGDNAFEGCLYMNSIMLLPSVKKIGENAFLNCPGIVIKCVKGSYAHHYAELSGIAYTLV